VTTRKRAILWWALTIVVALIFLYVATSDAIYELTSPPGSFQVLLRKSYSIGAFAIVGFLLSRALDASGRRRSVPFVGACVGAYSFVIEVLQAIGGSHEGPYWHAADVFCGFVGGCLGSFVERLRINRPNR